MKLWIGGILHTSISEFFREIRNATEETINRKIEGESYGSGITTWDVLLVILEDNHPKEYTRVDKATGETDVRILIDYSAFLCGSTKEREEMLQDALLESINRLSQKRIPNSDFLKLHKDVLGALGR